MENAWWSFSTVLSISPSTQGSVARARIQQGQRDLGWIGSTFACLPTGRRIVCHGDCQDRVRDGVRERENDGSAGELRALERVSMRAKQESKPNSVMIFWRHIT